MKCSDARKKLSALVDREGEPGARDAAAQHVAGCVACRGELEELLATDRALERAIGARAEPPAGYHEGLWARLEKRLDGDSVELADVRALADRALARASQGFELVSSDVLHAPAVLGQVVLPSDPPRRSRWPMALVAAGVVAAAGGAVLMVRGRGEPTVAAVAPTEPPAAAPAVAPVVAAPPTVPEPAPPPPPSAPVATPPPEEAPRPEKPALTTVPRDRPAEPVVAPPPKPTPTATPPAAPKKSADEIIKELTEKPSPAPAAPSTPAAGGAPGSEKLSHDQLKAGLGPFESRVQSCRPAADPRTVVVLKLRVSPDGTVSEIDAMPPHAGTPIGDCVARKAREAKFDSFDGPPMTVKYSYTLESDE